MSTQLTVCSIIREKNKIKEHVQNAGNRLARLSLGIVIKFLKKYENRSLFIRPKIFTLHLPFEFL